MRKLVLIAAMLMASASAHAGGFSFNVEGQKVRIDIPRGCSSLSCINVKAPGLADKFKSSEDTSTTSTAPSTTTPATTATAPAPASAPAPLPAPAAAPAPQTATAAPAPGLQAPAPTLAPDQANKVTMLPPPGTNTNSTNPTAPAASAPSTAAQPASAPAPTQVAAAPATPEATAPATPSPLGVWLSEKKEGKIRVEECGSNLCGYSIEKNGSNGAKVLVNMKPSGSKWSGTIKDPRGGGTYSGHIALRGSDKLRVTGCMFGFCGGETWTRAQ